MALKAWLVSLGLERYASAFEAAEVDLDALPYLTDEDLKDIGVPLGPRRRILAARDQAAAGRTREPATAAAGATEAATSSRERRQVTVMFVDLVGSTRLSAELDPELLGDLMGGYKDAVAREIAAAGGRVAKYLGDGVLAYFGWPRAREDAAESAIRCGFEVIGQVGRLRGPQDQPLQCRIGIATGLVVIGGEAGEGVAREDAIAGEAPNLAARLQALASADTMVISEATHRQVGEHFECEELGEQSIAGLAAPVRAWRPLRPAAHPTRFRAARARRTSFVGRAHELSLLVDRWSTAGEGAGRAVMVLGEAGMGKSRLAEALHDRIREEPHGFLTWQCSPYHQAKALYPVVECIGQMAGILDADPQAVRLAKLDDLLQAAEAPSEPFLPLFAQLLAIPPEAGYAAPALTPNQLRAATIQALIEWVRRASSLTPMFLLVEDAHWMDATTLELLALLVGSIGDVPVLSVVTARPEFKSPWSGRADVSIIGLDRLSSRDCEGLVREIAASVLPQAEVVHEIVSRSDGNPLYLEELSAAVVEMQASVRQAVPDSLQNSLMARLDHLGEAKHTAQICSVLGRRFARPLLLLVAGQAADLLDANLSILVAHDIIRPIGGPAGGRYEFKHALVRDAAYESLLLSQRRALHESCGRHLEQAFPEVARLEPELLAHHFRVAGLVEQAGRYAEQAGDRAAATCALVEAIASYQAALEQNQLSPAGTARDRRTLALLLKLGPALAIVGGAQSPQLKALYTEAEALGRTADDRDALFKATWGLWYNANIGRDLEDAAAYADRLVTISEQSDNEDHRVEALHCRWSSALFRADYASCASDAGLGAELYDKDRHHRLGQLFGGHDPGVCALGCRGLALAFAGEAEAGLNLLDAALELAESLDHPSSLAHAILQDLILTTVLRQPERLAPRAQRMLDLGRKYNVRPQQVMGAYHLAWIEAEHGERSKGLDEMAALHDEATKLGPIILLYKVMYIDQLLRAGRAEEALARADQAVAALRFPDMGLVLSELFRLRGEGLAAVGRKAEAIAELARAEAMSSRDGAGLLRVRAAASLLRVEPGDQARATLETALAAFAGDRDLRDLTEARALLTA
ncbi:MAG TPA: AAA family ATPase [Phenylobacterium sp.]|nr:AAA family ATPase [Phenylobacterium sp.]